jgi:hypothetical protein
MDIVLAWDETPGPKIGYVEFQTTVSALMLSFEYSAAKNVNPIETGMKLHALAPSEEEGEAVAVVEALPDMTMTEGLTGIAIAQGAMRMTMVPGEVAVAGRRTTIGSMVTGKVVTAMHPKIVMWAGNSILSPPPRLHQ